MTLTQATLGDRKRISNLEDYNHLYEKSLAANEEFWREESNELHWFYEPYSVFEEHGPGEFVWFAGGRLNAAVNCVDRHAAADPDKTAIIFVKDEPGEYEHISFGDLKTAVGRTANALKSLGVRKGDRVCIYLPMIPELAYTMLACARIGAVHSIVFGGFSADALRDRIIDAQAKILVTANEGLRGSKRIPLKKISDDAVEGLGVVEKVLVVKRTDAEVKMEHGRDIWMHEATAEERITCPAEWMGLRRSALHPVHLRIDRKAQGPRPHDRRLPHLRRVDIQVRLRRRSRRHPLLRRRHRLDHRPQLHRLRAARVWRHHRHVRVGPDIPQRK